MSWWQFWKTDDSSEPADVEIPEPESKPLYLPLARQRPCMGPGACGLTPGEWSGVTVWRCSVCQFQTFDETEAKRFIGAPHG